MHKHKGLFIHRCDRPSLDPSLLDFLYSTTVARSCALFCHFGYRQ